MQYQKMEYRETGELIIGFLEERSKRAPSGVATSKDLAQYATRKGIFIPGNSNLQIARRISDFIRISKNDHLVPFGLDEIEGFSFAIKFRWWKK